MFCADRPKRRKSNRLRQYRSPLRQRQIRQVLPPRSRKRLSMTLCVPAHHCTTLDATYCRRSSCRDEHSASTTLESLVKLILEMITHIDLNDCTLPESVSPELSKYGSSTHMSVRVLQDLAFILTKLASLRMPAPLLRSSGFHS
jgi:hypothetical protein